jgi:PKD repeat protein
MTTEPNPVCLGAEFNFIDSSTTFWSPITSWEWTYDGNTSTLQSPVYTISTPGSYPITLKVMNDWGCVGTLSNTIVVNQPPDVTASPDTVVCVTDPATLYGYGALTYTWAAPATLSCTACNPTMQRH